MRSRLLVRHFLWRFLEHDLISPRTDRRVALAAIAGAAVTLSLFIATLIGLQYQLNNFIPPGITSLMSLDDRFLFVSTSMLVMAIAAVAAWDGLALDPRDTAVLGVLPVPRSVIVRTKFAAVALFASGALVAWNLVPTLLRALSLPIKLPIDGMGALRLTLAHGAATFAAGAFGFLAVLGLREGAYALLGARRFQAIASALQVVLIVVLTTAWLVLPVAGADVARKWMAGAGPVATAVPPLWFVGLHEVLAGSVIDDLPRTRPQSFLIVPEREATELYRSLWPLYRELSTIAVTALIVVAVVAILACRWNSRRLPLVSQGHTRPPGVLRQRWNWAVTHIVARTPAHQAGFFFALHTLSRRVSHRVPMAAALAVALSFVVLTIARSEFGDATGLQSVPVATLAAQSLALISILSGFRHATRIPADLRASSTFTLAWTGQSAAYLAGVKRAGWLALAIPVLAGLFVVHSATLGPAVAVLHLGVGVCLSALVMETLFVRYRRVPMVSSYVPSEDLKSRGVLFLAAVLFVSFFLAWVERLALETRSGYVVLLAVLLGLSVSVLLFDRASREPAGALEIDDQDVLPTQRLNLAG